MKAITLDENGVVINVSLWTEDSSMPEGQIFNLVSDDTIVGPGWAKQGDTYVAPPKQPEPVEIPHSITRRQCAIELRERSLITPQEALDMTRTGIPPAMVQKIFSSMSETDQLIAETDFAADTYERSNVLLTSIMTASGASSEDIDEFFLSAARR
jgi:hypothetical protein